ncbi:PaaI family thioesterase [Castellaniella sp. GW247-6E4]|uniref:PaaI family thioesterase n=1 Tax=Castellaniella sp. GW247-6E4 TaxID=3140380 RepID=UPI0033158C10
MNENPAPSATRDELQARIQSSFERSGLLRHLGAHLGEVAPGRVHIHLPYGAELTQHLGFFHAGATTSIADTAGGFAALTMVPPGHTVLSVEFKINLMAPAQGESLEAVGRVIRAGRTLLVAQVDVYAVELGEKTPVALMQQTLMSISEK